MVKSHDFLQPFLVSIMTVRTFIVNEQSSDADPESACLFGILWL